MSRARRALVAFQLAAALLAATGAGAARAHQMNLSTARVELAADRSLSVEIALKGSDVDRVAGTGVSDPATGLVDEGRLGHARAAIAAYLGSHAVVEGADGAICKATGTRIEPDNDGVIATLGWSCGTVPGDLVYRSTVLTDIDPAARQVVLIGSGRNASQALLDSSRTEVRLTAPPPSLLAVIGRYVEGGIEHIFFGYDHVAFLVAVVLWARRFWPVIKIVTAFTLAHSITLSLAALKVVVISSSVVEPAIAASIVFVAVENFFSREIDIRWRYTFAFGLIHGFGFAAALQAFGLPRESLVPALGAFNLGVEIGQVAIVSLVMAALIAVDRLMAASRATTRPSREAPLVYALSGAIAILGCYWIVERMLLA